MSDLLSRELNAVSQAYTALMSEHRILLKHVGVLMPLIEKRVQENPCPEDRRALEAIQAYYHIVYGDFS